MTLAKLSFWRRVTFHTLLKETYDAGLSACDILVITAFTDDEIEEGLQKLRDAGNNVEVLTVEHTPEEELHAAD